MSETELHNFHPTIQIFVFYILFLRIYSQSILNIR